EEVAPVFAAPRFGVERLDELIRLSHRQPAFPHLSRPASRTRGASMRTDRDDQRQVRSAATKRCAQ
ncbi:hypothetical protein, partial [Sphingomonas melonis]|uniref:hypothetical protein n=1 Tax=Sphingomonas melonis TaxID=152682 RepID=UPI0035C80373